MELYHKNIYKTTVVYLFPELNLQVQPRLEISRAKSPKILSAKSTRYFKKFQLKGA